MRGPAFSIIPFPLPRSFELFVGLRYTRAKRRTQFVSFISMISMAGIALGIAALITVMSVMNGFEKEIRARILGAAAHVQILGGDAGLADWQRLADEARKNPEVTAAAPFVMGQGLLSAGGGSVRGVYVRGIVPRLEETVADFGQHMVAGRLEDLKPGEFGIVIGVGIARGLALGLGDRVTLISPQGQVTPAGLLPRLKQFTVVGIFRLDHNEYDNALALIDMQDGQALYRMGDRVSGVRLKLHDLDRAPAVARELTSSLPDDLYVTDWTRQNANYFRAIQIEKRMMFIILTLIIAVAAFNLVSTLVMAVTDKQPDIAILRTLGAAPASIMKIFVVQGAIIGVIGTVIGVVVGVLLALNIDVVVPFVEHTFHFQILSSDVYYISELPSDLHWRDAISVAAVSLFLSFIATIYPSWRASRVNPAEALRYE
ncbi:MAG TPA: lipoprotein-releasing ABC transporter permease subunit [Usitatibacter sp.]|nr:lipoprotein-releasing ABC transporter permease subunit [Usitatibacter sp.]